MRKTLSKSNIIELVSFKDLPAVSEPEAIYYVKNLDEYLAQCNGTYCPVELERDEPVE